MALSTMPRMGLENGSSPDTPVFEFNVDGVVSTTGESSTEDIAFAERKWMLIKACLQRPFPSGRWASNSDASYPGTGTMLHPVFWVQRQQLQCGQ